ncbi:tRNA (adenosine(37)-N6)-threonylcarbamoyltransferase complex dimerization subunit type 1 TsaB [Alkalibacterium iburiense]|uniref:tRNA (Adenosine(37)-N6)-threonylcarbamoyltransferase complex dimerization subunit type 1 TsaB n=1 Tax=Alkalibacterium iburiense TaxID=290589 RepID=A0ABN0X6D2_9LACT
MKSLGIDTSNQTMSVALVEDGKLRAERVVNVKRNHSIQLMPTIEALFKEVNWKPNELDRVVTAKGPGSYTGVRIGVTIAKTLAFTLGIDLVGVSSLKVLAANGERIPGSYIVPVFNARRDNLYTGLYHYRQDELVQVEADTHISAEKWAHYLKQLKAPIQIVGEDKERFEDLFKSVLGDMLYTLPAARDYPRASALIELGEKEEAEDVHVFEPDYIKLAEAEQKWVEANPGKLEGGEWVEKL